MIHKPFLAFALACLLASQVAYAQVEIRLSHSLEGTPAEKLDELVRRFNAAETRYRVTAEFRKATPGLNGTLSTAQGAAAPHLVQVPVSATGTLLAERSAFRPLHQVMADAGRKVDTRAFFAPLSAYFLDRQGRLVAFPFGSATPGFFYNKELFKKAGLDPERAPTTWREVQESALALYDAGVTCGYTTTWPAWIHLENLGAWHDEPIATRANGFEGGDAKLTFNGIMMLRHVALLSSWLKSRIFTYAGRRNEADAMFHAGECGMLTTSSAAYAEIARKAQFSFGIGAMPYYDEFPGAPFNSIPDGTGLWVTAGKTAAEYNGVASFIAFLMRPEIEAEWHQHTGYLPASQAAYDLSRTQGFYEKHPGFEVFVRQLTRKAPRPNSRGLRVPNLAQVRELVDDELESVWNGLKTPKEALDEAVLSGNQLLRRRPERPVRP